MENNNSANNSQSQKNHSSDDGQGEPIVTHQMEHPGVTCDNCKSKVCGFRYKCMQCPDFDLCHSCERKGHHVGHVMLRIPFPEQSIDAIPRYCSQATTPAPESPFQWGRPGIFGFGRHGHGPHGHGLRGHGPHGRGWGRGGINRCAEAFMKNISGQNATNNPGNEDKDSAPQQFDWTTASSQVQEFLNAWGVPINVADFCPQQPKAGETTAEAQGPNTANVPPPTNGTEKEKSSDGMDHSGSSFGTPPQQPSNSSSSSSSAPQTPFTSLSGNTNEPAQPSPLGAFLNNTLKNPQVQQIIQGVATAAENAAKNIPTSNPFTPGNSFPSFTATAPPNSNSQQEEINTATLNQLLTMGFSNEGGWLERLVIAKKGNLESVLNSLFSGANQ